MYKRILLGVIVALLSITSVVSFSAIAQEAENTAETQGAAGFRISPTREDLEIDRGTSETKTITVRNVTGTTQTARPVVDDFGASSDESGTPNLLIGDLAVDNYPYSIKPFVANLDTLTLEPGEERQIDVTYTVPQDTSPGSYYGVLRFVSDSEAEEVQGQAGVTLNAAVGLIILINVPGETIDLLELVEASALLNGAAGSMFSEAPNSYMFRIENKGNTFQAPFGRVSVKNWSGDVVYEYELNQPEGGGAPGNVLPESVRRFENPIENIGSFGRFTVEANISYGDGGSIISSETVFWVIPWLTVLIVVVVIVVLVFGATRGLKAYNRRVIESSKGTRVKKK